MKEISSRANPLYKELVRAHQNAGKPGKAVVLEGVHLCQAWLDAGRIPECVVIDRTRSNHAEVQSILAVVEQDKIVLIDSPLFKTLSDVVTSQGILFVVSAPLARSSVTPQQNAVILDRIQDPGNVGTILRTAAAAGVRHVYASEQTAGLWTPKVLRSAQGAHFVLSLHERVDLDQLLDQISVPVIATSLTQATDLYATKLPEYCAWMFGNEGQGVRPELIEKASMRVRIPFDIQAVESLNVSVCAALCLFEQRRQHPIKPAS